MVEKDLHVTEERAPCPASGTANWLRLSTNTAICRECGQYCRIISYQSHGSALENHYFSMSVDHKPPEHFRNVSSYKNLQISTDALKC